MTAKTMKGDIPMKKQYGLWILAPVVLTLGLVLLAASAARADIIVDNDGPGTSSTGRWYVSGGGTCYGVNSLYSKVAGSTFTYSAAMSGKQNVYLWWTTIPSRCTSVKVQIYNGSTLLGTKYVNQSVNGGKWNVLGTYSFSEIGKVKITSSSAGSCTTCADAVKFSPSTGDIYELDDVYGQAKILYNAILNPNQVQTRSIHAPGDVDWAKFTLTRTSQVTIATNGSSGDTEMWLYGPDSPYSLIQYDDDSGDGNFSMIKRTLNPGTYYIKIAEYQNNGTIPSYTLSLAYPLVPGCQFIPPADHWKGEYFNNKTLSGSPVMTSDDGLADRFYMGMGGQLDFDWGYSSPSSGCGVPADNFSVRWTTTVSLSASSIYLFNMRSNTGARLWVNGQLVIDRWADNHSGSEVYVYCPQGPAFIKMEYYSGTGAADAHLIYVVYTN
jgi:hypothetical protein